MFCNTSTKQLTLLNQCLLALVHAYPKRIPIGALFESNSRLSHAAFHFAVDLHNNVNNTSSSSGGGSTSHSAALAAAAAAASAASSFKVDKHEKIISDMDDSFQISRALCSTMSKGIFALFGAASNHTTLSTTDSFVRMLNMPYITPSAPISQTLLTRAEEYRARRPAGKADTNDVEAIRGGGGKGWGTRAFGPEQHTMGFSSSSSSSSGGQYTLYLRPSYDRPLLDIALYYRWKHLIYLFDDIDGLFRLEQLYSRIQSENIDVEIEAMRLPSLHNSYALLRKLDTASNTSSKHLVLDLSTEAALQSVLLQIQNLGMHRSGYHYLLGGLTIDELDVRRFRYGGVNITGFRLIDTDMQSSLQTTKREWLTKIDDSTGINRGLNVVASKQNTLQLEAALTIDAVDVIIRGLTSLFNEDPDVFRSTFRRGQFFNNETRGIQCRGDPLIPWMHGPAIFKKLSAVEFNGLTGHVSFDEYGHRKDYKLDVIEMGFNSEPKKIGYWNSTSGLFMIRDLKLSNGSGDSSKQANRTYIVTSIIASMTSQVHNNTGCKPDKSAPYLTFKKNQTDGPPLSGNDQFEGYIADLARLIAGKVHFEYELRLVRDGKYGALTTNGTWNGMIGELTREGEADIAMAPLSITAVRERVVDFTKPFMNLGISIMIKKPENQKPGVFSFLDPLDYMIWMCIVFSYLGVSVGLFLVSRFSPYEWQIEDNTASGQPSYTNDFTLYNSLWFSLAAFMQQGCDISPRSASGRVAGSAWWFFTLIIISTYTANLAAFLTVESMLIPINSVDDLAKQTAIQYGTLDAGSTKDFFKSSKVAVYEKMWKYMNSAIPSVFVKTTEEGIQRVGTSKGKYAFILESTMNEYYNQKKPCNTMKVGDNLDSKGYGVATPIGSPLKGPIGLAVLSLTESGELQKLHKKWWYDKGECGSEGDSKGGGSQSALTLSNVAGIFYILVSGLGLSMIVSFVEFLCKSRNNSKKAAVNFMGFKTQQIVETDDVTHSYTSVIKSTSKSPVMYD